MNSEDREKFISEINKMSISELSGTRKQLSNLLDKLIDSLTKYRDETVYEKVKQVSLYEEQLKLVTGLIIGKVV